MNTNVLYSVFNRNFFSYLSNPTGYVFICVFVLLSSIAAFLPNEFFNANLANLDQLNIWFPLIMLVFVPAITMGIWADERRQGTDELLLTIPASDFDIVLGKFLAAVCIYTIALLFSMVCNLATLRYLGTPDVGLFCCTYIGYWLIGVSMISIGMVASFLTGNLTVAYIFGAFFCAPLIVLQWVDIAPVSIEAALLLKSFSIPAQFDLFGRGIVNFSSIVYFTMITATMLYMSMVLIGRRHWTATQKFIGTFHYTCRTLSLLIIGLSLCFFFRQHDLRGDLTEEKLSTLSPETVNLLKNLKPEHPVVIEAFLSPSVPESHGQTRMDIVSILGEIESLCGKNVSVRIYPTESHTPRAMIASQRYNIAPQEVSFSSGGKREIKSVYLGVTFRCGLSTTTLPFIDRGLSVEYELVQALCGLTMPMKKRVGVLKTDAALFGQLDMNTYQMTPQWQIIEELQKQYTVVEVDPAAPIRERFDVLLAVQPSAMGPQETEHFIDAIMAGQPAVICEDPLPVYVRGVGGTDQPRPQGNQMMMMMGRQNPKGNLAPLWPLLGVNLDGSQAVWQWYSPIKKLPQIPKGFVFLDRSLAQKKNGTLDSIPFNLKDPVTASLQYLMLPFPGRITAARQEGASLEMTPILWTFQSPFGSVGVRAVMQGLASGSWEQACIPKESAENLAVRIHGELPPPPAPPVGEGETPIKPEPIRINVVLVADIDILSDTMFGLRRYGNEPNSGINLNFDNVSFVLNAIDSVAGDERFLAIRNRRPKHRTLSKFDENTAKFRASSSEKRATVQEQFDDQIKSEEEGLNSQMQELREGLEKGSVNQEEAARKLGTAVMTLQKRLSTAKERLQRDLDNQIEQADNELNANIQRIQGRYKMQAVVFPPIPPLIIGAIVFFVRRIRESEGVPQSRRRTNASK